MNFSLWHFFGAPPINSPAFFSHFSGKRGAPGGNGAEKCAGRGKIKKPGNILGGDPNSGDISLGSSENSQEILRGGGISQEEPRSLADFQKFQEFPGISQKILRGGGISQKKRKYSGFSGPPGARPGGGPGGPPKIATSRRIPHLRWSIKARTPDLAPAGTERRKTAAAWETDHATFPFGTFLGRRLSIPRLFSRTFPEKGGRRGATGRKSARDAGKIKSPGIFSGGTGTPGAFPSDSQKILRESSAAVGFLRKNQDPPRIFRNSRNLPEFLRKILRGGGIPQKKVEIFRISRAPRGPARGRARGPAKNRNFPPDSPPSPEH